jgi:hypothetical protein
MNFNVGLASASGALLRVTLLGVTVCCAAGCAGNGDGLDENGRPVGSAGGALTADLRSIQDHVFTPICTQCHVGAAAPLGLRLDESSAYAMLVNAPGSEVPSLRRVVPGDPDNSYLIQKLEGRAAVGGQMPLGQPALPPATIAAIRQWIADGALAAMEGSPSVMPMQLRAVVPAPGAALVPGRGEILVQAAGELKVATLSSASVALVRSGPDGRFDESTETVVQPMRIEVRSLTPTVLAIGLDGATWAPGTYRLTVSGHGRSAARDSADIQIGDFMLQFSVGDPR